MAEHLNQTQLHFVRTLLGHLWNQGVREFCVCAGSRNSPFVELLSTVQDVQVWWGFEERSAAFFALGRGRQSGRPVAVVTTSGTAVAELLPAAIEAYHSGSPLVLISCDRPKKQIGTGSPQTIEQSQIFKNFAKQLSLDPALPANVEGQTGLSQLRDVIVPMEMPLHMNIHLDEPLLDEPALVGVPWRIGDFCTQVLDRATQVQSQSPAERQSEPSLSIEALQNLNDVLVSHKHVLIYMGPMTPQQAEIARAAALKFQCPIWAEATSQLREDQKLKKFLLPWGEFSARGTQWDAIIRIGGVPTARLWRDLESKHIPVITFAPTPYWSGLARESRVFSLDALKNVSENSILFQQYANQPNVENRQSLIQENNEMLSQRVAGLFENYPASEPAALRRLSEIIPERANIYLGNSLPIRIWDWAAVRSKVWTYGCNRGANGIDGQISTFLGWSQPDQENWAIIGDLTALYDLTSFWYARAMPQTPLRVVIVNNGGGQIFSHIYNNAAFINSHNLNFKSVAELWGWGYVQTNLLAPIEQRFHMHQLMELQVNQEQTQALYNDLKSLGPQR